MKGRWTALVAGMGVITATVRAEAAGLDGRWVLLQSTTTRVDVPVLGEVDATTTVVSLHDVVSEGERLRGAGTLCALDVDSGTSLARTTLPPALRRVLPVPSIDAVLRRSGERMAFWQAMPTVILGARLARPADALPEEAEDPRVGDDDRDGHPGVTVRVDGLASGEIHVVQRTWSRLDGFLLRDGTFGGIIRHGVSQSILGASSPLLELGPEIRPVPALSYFRLARVAADAGCADALKRSRSLKR